MKSKHIFIVVLSILFAACNDNISDMGSQIQPEGDKILVDTASLSLSTENIIIPFIYSRPDSLMMGSYVDLQYGTTNADILTQLQPPIDFTYPAGAKADSAQLILYYYSWFGDRYAPMELSVYQMNKNKTLNFTKLYQSDINASEYSDKTNKIGGKIFTAKDAVLTRPDSTKLIFPLTKDFVNSFSAVLTKKYTFENENTFHSFFNGIYITTNFGSASMLYIRSVVMRYFFHYTYNVKKADGISDSTVVVNTYVNYPANKEVRTVNRVQHPDASSIKQKFDANPQISVISSPANIYTKIKMPIRKLQSKLIMNGKKLLINKAVLRVDIAEIDTTLAQPLPNTLLLIKESQYDEFFKDNKLPTDTTAIIADIEREIVNGEILYFYSFDMARMLTKKLNSSTALPEFENFRLVPVSVKYDGNKQISQMKPQNLMSACKICSGQHSKRPMKLNLVYSGF